MDTDDVTTTENEAGARPRVRVGCGPLPDRRDDLFRTYACAEVTDTVQGPVRYNTLRKWSAEKPAGFDFSLGAWRWLSLEPLDERGAPPFDFPKRSFGLFQPTDANRAVWAEVVAQADALGAASILFRTAPSFTPSQVNIDNLRRFRAEIIGDTPVELVWEPRGIWAREELDDLGEELRLTITRDPHAEALLPEPVDGDPYYVVTAPPGRVRFSAEDMFELAAFLRDHEGSPRAIFRGPDRDSNARALLSALAR